MDTDIETRAKEMGWSPKEEFRGDPDKWVDAETFVKKGEEFLPILKATTKKQAETIKNLERRVQETSEKLAAATDAIEALKETTSKAAIQEVKKQQQELKGALKEAREAGDVDAELEINEKLQETTQILKQTEKAPEKKETKTVDPTDTPEWKEWVAENSWFGSDRRKTALAMGIAQELRENGDKTTGRAFFDKVTEELNKTLGEPVRTPKVEGDTRGTGNSGSGGKSYANLPPEAKAACERQAARVVGPGRAFKSVEDWRKHYAAKYFEE